MAYTLKRVAEMSGVSVRTLRFYGSTGLLKPAYAGAPRSHRFPSSCRHGCRAQDEESHKWVRRLNPPAAVAPFAKAFERERVGTFTELGTKRVCETRGIAVSADRSLVATASTYSACLFDVRRMKQLWCREFATGRRALSIT